MKQLYCVGDIRKRNSNDEKDLSQEFAEEHAEGNVTSELSQYIFRSFVVVYLFSVFHPYYLVCLLQ